MEILRIPLKPEGYRVLLKLAKFKKRPVSQKQKTIDQINFHH